MEKDENKAAESRLYIYLSPNIFNYFFKKSTFLSFFVGSKMMPQNIIGGKMFWHFLKAHERTLIFLGLVNFIRVLKNR